MWSKNNFYFWQLHGIKGWSRYAESLSNLPASQPAMMNNSVLTSVLVLLAGLSLVLATNSTQTEREARSVIVSETLQVMNTSTSTNSQ